LHPALKVKQMKSTYSGPAGIVAFLVFLMVPDSSAAQLREVQQTVYGMDCAPCAYGLEKRMKRMDGVQDASVSLNKGLAHMEFESDHSATLQSIRIAIIESGFSAEEATVRVSGTLLQDGDDWLLLAGEERFALPSPPPLAQADSRVTLTGRVAKNKIPNTDAWTLDISVD